MTYPLLKRVISQYHDTPALQGFDIDSQYASSLLVPEMSIDCHFELINAAPIDQMFHMAFFTNNHIDLDVWETLHRYISRLSSDRSIRHSIIYPCGTYRRDWGNMDPLYMLLSLKDRPLLIADVCSNVLKVPPLVFDDIFFQYSEPTHIGIISKIRSFIDMVKNGREIYQKYQQPGII